MEEWSGPGSNRQPLACKASALPIELPPREWIDRIRLALASALTLLAAVSCAPGPAGAGAPGGAGVETVALVVRHAEKEAGQDPGLTAAGRSRARELAEVAASFGVRAVYATPLRRSVETARPAAARAKVAVDTRFGPREASSMAAEILSRREPALIVGHSNTVPAIVRALGGGAIDPMPEDEYDRLLVVRISAMGARAETRRYGARSPRRGPR